MNVITTFSEKRREKQMKYEKTVLKDISVQILKEKTRSYFHSINLFTHQGVEEACYDVAIEAFLLGANLSKFGYLGEKMETIRLRCQLEIDYIIDTLYHFLLFCGVEDEILNNEALPLICEQYVEEWWEEGFKKGERRHKLRLH
ncbi:DUF2521 family protein [Bacillaceae bacterium Marseille-Q3522]|nr:DUF2521 family protein [Bacillaceae bacterium Marseille-Q3522]